MKIYTHFFPDYFCRDITGISIGFLKKHNIKYILLDIDNTLVPYTEPLPDKRALDFLNMLTENGIKYCFVSNNNSSRAELFNKDLGAPVYAKAKKPLLYGINKAMKELGANKNNTAFIGDQIFTDIYGGKRAGILTVLVESIKEVDTLFFRFKKYFENKIVEYYIKTGSMKDCSVPEE